MEERRRRAQRPTQNIQEQPEQEEGVKQEAASVQAASQSAAQAPRRRRNAQHAEQQEAPQFRQESAVAQTSGIKAVGEKAGREQPETGNRAAKEKKRLSAPATLRGERLKGVVNTSAKAGKKAVQGMGGLFVLVMLLMSEGMKKLRALAGRMPVMTGSRDQKPQQSGAQAEQAYELELIRPEDYHGRGQAHAQKTGTHQKPDERKRTDQRTKAQRISNLISALLVCVALFSLWQIGSIVVRSVRTRSLNNELSRQRAELMEQAQDESGDQEAAEEELQGDALPTAAYTAQPIVQPTMEPTLEPVPQATATPAPDVVKTTKYRQMGGDPLPEMAALYEKNRDLVAWIQIPDVLDLPVVYRDNSYYLTRDFNKQKNAAGTIFLDVNHPFKEKTQNLLLHGHNMKDGTMFGRLAQYLYDDTYIRNHPFIYFDTLWKKEQYVIVAILNVSLDTKDKRFFNYFTHDTFSSDAEFQSYIRQLQLRSHYAIPIDVQPGDALLTLSTCLEEDRLVIVARRLRENETRSELRTLIRMTTIQ